MSKQVKDLINAINTADETQVGCQFDIANMLTAIHDHQLYLKADYDSFAMFCKCEFDFSHYIAKKYVALHTHYTRLRYSKTEFVKLMRQFGWRNVLECIKDSPKKIGYRKIKSLIDARGSDPRCQMNIALTDQDAVRIDAILQRFGMSSATTGRRSNLSSALVALVEDYERLESRTRRKAA